MIAKSFSAWRVVERWVLMTLVGLLGCQAKAQKSDPQPAAQPGSADSVQLAKITLTSSAFTEGTPIPKKYTGEGSDVSPPLTWTGLPTATKELALVCDDPDAPGGEPWVHWVIYKIPVHAVGLPEGVEKKAQPAEPAGALQGRNSWPSDNLGYRGPKPPPGTPHRYFFSLYALDAELAVAPGLTKKALFQAMKGHEIGKGQLMGTFQR